MRSLSDKGITMQSILTPVAVIVRNLLSKREGDKLLEVTGWVECLLSPIANLRHGSYISE
jgi:hypothetical protein